jgi:hypothetical protein
VLSTEIAQAIPQNDPMKHWHVLLRHPYGGYIDLGYHTEASAKELVGDLTSAVHAYQSIASIANK